MIDVECIFCGAVLKAPESAIGKTGKCSKCFKQIKIFEKESRPKDVSPPIEPASKTEHFCSNCGSPSKEGGNFCSTCGNSFTQNEKSKDRRVRLSSAWENLNDRFDSKVRFFFNKKDKSDDLPYYLITFVLFIISFLLVLPQDSKPKGIEFREVSNNTVEMIVPVGTSRKKAIDSALRKVYSFAKSNPDQYLLRLKWIMPKEGLADNYGNRLKEDVEMGVMNWGPGHLSLDNLDEVRKYQDLAYFLQEQEKDYRREYLNYIIEGMKAHHLLVD